MKEQNTSVSPYKYKDKFLSGEIVSELILETFDKQLRVSRQEIVKKVKELHRSRGGLLNSAPERLYCYCIRSGSSKVDISAKGI